MSCQKQVCLGSFVLQKSKFVLIIKTNPTTKTCLDSPAKLSRFVLSTKTDVQDGRTTYPRWLQSDQRGGGRPQVHFRPHEGALEHHACCDNDSRSLKYVNWKRRSPRSLKGMYDLTWYHTPQNSSGHINSNRLLYCWVYCYVDFNVFYNLPLISSYDCCTIHFLFFIGSKKYLLVSISLRICLY